MAGVLLIVLVRGFDDGYDLATNLGWRFVLDIALLTGSLLLSGLAWCELVGMNIREGLRAFATALPGRYLPLGGLFQLASQAGLSVASGAAKSRVGIATPLFLATGVAGAITIAIPLVATSDVTWVRVATGLAAITLALVLVFGLPWLRRRTDRAPQLSPRIARRAFFLFAVSMLFNAVGFWTLLPESTSLSAIPAYAAAWVVGTLVVIAPTGLGIREAALVFLIPSMTPPDVVAASLAHRGATIIAELLVFAIAWRLTSVMSPKSSEASGS